MIGQMDSQHIPTTKAYTPVRSYNQIHWGTFTKGPNAAISSGFAIISVLQRIAPVFWCMRLDCGASALACMRQKSGAIGQPDGFRQTVEFKKGIVSQDQHSHAPERRR
ncbi:hypothetical protein GDO81_021359 [Engystomops pustulosus]|uniref:Uncharacterized protein n=1 Tax=Engystomops pustulosus TaxID=76066 RepID=A0AAV6YR47_ENGPU|nr:hypothetical protein GDO81_021359 [Engystomops pustulosus]